MPTPAMAARSTDCPTTWLPSKVIWATEGRLRAGRIRIANRSVAVDTTRAAIFLVLPLDARYSWIQPT